MIYVIFIVLAVFACTLKYRFVVFVGVPEKGRFIRGNDRYGGLFKMEIVQGPQKLNDESGKTIHLGMIDRGFTVDDLNVTDAWN
jgi:hypothetical protein